MNITLGSQQISTGKPIDRALVVIDGTSNTDREALLEKTKAISGALACDLHLVHCVDKQALQPSAVQDFENQLCNLDEINGDVSGTLLNASDWAHAIGRTAADVNADLIIKQADALNHQRLGLSDHGDWRLMRNERTPVWFIKQPDRAVNDVVAAVGHSSENATREHAYIDTSSYQIYDAAKQAAEDMGSQVHPIHVVEGGLSGLPDYDIANRGNILSYADDDSSRSSGHTANATASHHGRQLQALEKEVARTGSTLSVRAGTTEDALLDFCQEVDADLLVIGAKPMTRWQRLRTSPVAEPVLASAPCDVLAVPIRAIHT